MRVANKGAVGIAAGMLVGAAVTGELFSKGAFPQVSGTKGQVSLSNKGRK
jgi:hypothetical protein